MKKIKYSLTQLLIVSLIAFSNITYSQVTEFRTGKAEFLLDLQSHLAAVDKQFARKFIQEFTPLYNSNYNSGQKVVLAKFANELLKKKVRTKPDFINYCKSIKGFVKSKQFNNEEFTNWETIMKRLFKLRDRKKVNKFNAVTATLFNDNVIYGSSSTKWHLEKGTFSFKYSKGPMIIFKDVDLKCTSKKNVSNIYNTNGVFNVLTGNFRGKGGEVTWERVKLPKGETYATLSNYRINMKRSGFNADSVTMHSTYLVKPTLGKLAEKLVSNPNYKKANYPAFTSYDQKIEIKNVFPDIDYSGEFKLAGLKFIGGASGKNFAKIIIKNNNKEFIIIESKNVNISKSKITAPNSKSTIYLRDKETIKQFSSKFIYNNRTKEVTLSRAENKTIKVPFESSFHQLSMSFEKLSWKKGKEILTFGSFKGGAGTGSEAMFESSNFYSNRNYNKLQGYNTNVIHKLYMYQKKRGGEKKLNAVNFASYLGSLTEDVEHFLVEMGNMGLIDYDYKAKLIFVKPKLKHYIVARTKRGDYDDIFIKSLVKNGNNAILNFTTNMLIVKGIRKFNISRNKNVKVYPKGGTIEINKNRNFIVNGVVNVGRTELFGEYMFFDYDKFEFAFEELDSMRVRVIPQTDSMRQLQKQVRLYTKLEVLTGKILVDHPKNKAGKNTKFYNFPKLNITNTPYVYFDNKKILKGIYDRKNFYFQIDPFEMDSLNYFHNSGIDFPGQLVSADIFPPFNQSLRLMPDYSLGFKIKNIAKPIYNGAAKYNNTLILNRKGLIGRGLLSFMTSSGRSDKITFYPDSMVAKTGLYTNKTQTVPPVPEIKGKNCFIIFQPHKGIWMARNIDTAMHIFNDGKTRYLGTIRLDKNGMTGWGDIVSGRVVLNSKNYTMGQNNIDAKSAEFTLNGRTEDDPPSLEAIDMKMHLDFTGRKGEFVSNSGNSLIEFPANKFKSYTDKFDWFMDDNYMNFTKVIDIEDVKNLDENKNIKPNFIAMLPEHHELGFYSGISRYDIDSNKLTCKKIPYIVVADSRIIPNKGQIIIRKKGKIDPIFNSEIVTNYITKYHTFKEVEATIISKKKYTAKGKYTVSRDSTIFSDVYFHSIEPNDSLFTIAEASIPASANFYLSPQFKYFGDIKVRGNKLAVDYLGQTKIVTKCNNLTVDWIKFKASVDTNKIIIPLGEEFADKVSGPVMSKENGIEFYTAFLAKKINTKDISITPAVGYLSYNKKKGLFEIGTEAKLKNNKAAGNYISFDDESCQFNTIGELHIGDGMDQMEIDIVGEMSYNKLIDTAIKINATMSLEFPINYAAILQMHKTIKNVQVQELMNLPETNYELFINHKLEPKDAKNAMTQISKIGRIGKKLPKPLLSTMTIFDLQFIWNEGSQSFLSDGWANIATLGSHQLYKRCKIKVQIQKRRTGDIFNLFIESSPQNYYFFSYKNGVLQTVSTDLAYNKIIKETKPANTKSRAKNGKKKYQYRLAKNSKPMLFLRNFEVAKGGEEVEEEEDFDEEEEEMEEMEEEEEMEEDETGEEEEEEE